MPVVNVAQHSFGQGELGPNLLYRPDEPTYRAGAQTVENYLVLPTGGLWKRPGFKYLADLDGYTRLINFSFSDEQEYVIALGAGVIKIFRDGAEVYSASSQAWTTTSIVQHLRYTQSFDTLLLFHPDVVPQKVVRGGSHTSWSISDWTVEQYPMNRYSDAGTITITPSATTGSVTLTASSALFTDDWHSKQLRINSGYATVQASGLTGTPSTTCTATVTTTLSGTGADAAWEEQSWSAHRGYPRSGTFHQNRLVIGGSKSLPQTIWGSRTTEFFNFDATDPDDDSYGFNFEIGSDKANVIRAVFSLRGLQIFTSSREFVERSSPITPSSVNFQAQTSYGMNQNGVTPIILDDFTVFIESTGKQLRSFRYDFGTDAFSADNLTLKAHHILSDPVDMVLLRSFADTQANYIIAVNDDGELAVLAIHGSESVLGWSRFTTPGGDFKSVTVVDDTLYAIVDRDGSYFLECMEDVTDATTGKRVYVDHWVKDTGSASATWTVGEFLSDTVDVVGDGYSFLNIATDGSGNLDLGTEVETIYTGYAYTATMETMPMVVALPNGLTKGERIRKLKSAIRVRNTADLTVDNKIVPTRRLGTSLLDEDTPTVAKTIVVRLAGIGFDPTVTIKSTEPQPQTLLGLNTELKVGN
ncbi:hypothetical protein [Pacificispira sp.]|uniref:hypothetical protein n=1 Tax=Pacificispira sp. TaxID=2888761 RepID=UPI003BADB512